MATPDATHRPAQLSRRTFLRVLAAAGGTSLLAACGSAPAAVSSASGDAPVTASPAASDTSVTASSVASDAPASVAASTAAASSPSAAGAAGEISYFIWDLGPDVNAARQEMVTAFQDANPDVTVNMSILPIIEMWDKVGAQMAAGQPPDVFPNDIPVATYAQNGQLLDLTERVAADAAFADLNSFTTDPFDDIMVRYGTDKTFVVNEGTWVPVMYYNIDLFEAAGVELPDQTWTWDQVREAAKRLTNVEQGQYGVQFSTPYEMLSFMWWSAKPDTFWADPQVFPTKTVLNTAPGLGAFTIMHNLSVVDKTAIPEAEVKSYQTYAGGFSNGKVGMFFGSDWDVGWSFRAAPFRWGVTMFPMVTPDERPAMNANFSGHVVAAASKNPDPAWSFVQFMATDPDAQLALGKGAYTMPILKQAATNDAVLKPEWAPPGYATRLEAVSLPGPMRNPYPLAKSGYEFLFNHIWPTVDQLRLGELTPEQAATTLDTTALAFFKTK